MQDREWGALRAERFVCCANGRMRTSFAGGCACGAGWGMKAVRRSPFAPSRVGNNIRRGRRLDAPERMNRDSTENRRHGGRTAACRPVGISVLPGQKKMPAGPWSGASAALQTVVEPRNGASRRRPLREFLEPRNGASRRRPLRMFVEPKKHINNQNAKRFP